MYDLNSYVRFCQVTIAFWGHFLVDIYAVPYRMASGPMGIPALSFR